MKQTTIDLMQITPSTQYNTVAPKPSGLGDCEETWNRLVVFSSPGTTMHDLKYAKLLQKRLIYTWGYVPHLHSCIMEHHPVTDHECFLNIFGNTVEVPEWTR